jgi:threonyl-tRNA synthetase
MLQRIYGTAFLKQKDLDADLKRRQEARERDHRVIGNELDLFFVDPKVGAGLPYWMPNGATIRRQIERYIIDKEVANGYQHVYTPVLANLDAFTRLLVTGTTTVKTCSHQWTWVTAKIGITANELPITYPIYKHHIRSYRELPLRIAELGMMHRYEKSGALTGLQRVREMTLNDGHTFVALIKLKKNSKRS